MMPLQLSLGLCHGHINTIPTATYGSVMSAIANCGGKWLRSDIGWSTIQPGYSGAYSAIAISQIQAIMASAASHNLKVLIPLAVGSGGGLFPSNVTPSQYAAMAAYVVSQCPGGYWEILNEPDYSGTPAATYAQVVAAAYPAMKAADPTCTVVAGVLSNISSNCQAYWNTCYSNGIMGNYDVISVHSYDGPSPYTDSYDPGSRFSAQLAAFRSLVTAAGDTAPLWLTEFGWETDTGQYRTVSPANQAAFIGRWLTELSAANMPVAIVYCLADGSSNGGYGIMDNNFNAKPAYTVIKQLMIRQPYRIMDVAGYHYRLS